jgi:two-component system, OmpR family, sensor kinase
MTLTSRRLALTNSLIMFGAVVLFALVLVPARSALTLRLIDAELAATGDSFAQSASTSALPATDVFAERPVFVQSMRLDGSIVVRSANIGEAQLPADAASLTRAQNGDGQPRFTSIAVDGHQLRRYERPIRSSAAEPQSPIIGIVDVATPLDASLPRGPVLLSLIVGIAIGTLGIVALGWLFARLALAPVDRLAVMVDSISSTHDLSRRLPVDTSGGVRLDPVVRLTYAFNAMLDRLQSSTEQLERSLHLQRQFVGDASHQLRTPLTSLRGNIDLLSEMCAEDCPHASVDEHQAILHDLSAESERMSRLVDGLLLLARADAQQHLDRSPLQLEPLIKDAWRTARSLSVSVSVKLGEVPSGLSVRADPDRLVQLFTTLLENAVHYSPPGAVVWLRARLEGRHGVPGAVVEVADAGPGIPVSERSRIFERFYRSRVTATAIDGVGLGLAVARWIADEHEAEISVTDNEPVGSIFQVWLPITRS